ncbi:hypothetical protein M5K25_009850 [Dendrobium thyrsiflorum]|uniref:Uncharacterized protein n=1 Tax=Dendrobium thyrsiflorum TaxID=117978 RepID=A0ABD0V780_DENTH
MAFYLNSMSPSPLISLSKASAFILAAASSMTSTIFSTSLLALSCSFNTFSNFLLCSFIEETPKSKKISSHCLPFRLCTIFLGEHPKQHITRVGEGDLLSTEGDAPNSSRSSFL